MQVTMLGRTDIQVSRLCLGTMTFGWSTDEPTAFAILDAARDQGINFFDTADYYSAWVEHNHGGESETILGRWLKGQPRQDIVIATKVRGRMWPGPTGEGLSRAHIVRAVEDSLRRLQTDYIDLYQVHWPDENTPLEETLSALDSLVQAGKVRSIGASNHPAALLDKALHVSAITQYARFDCLQPHYSLLHRDEFERELAALCRDQDIAVIPYSPLAAGFLTGKYTRDSRNPDTARPRSSLINRLRQDENAYKTLDVVERIARAHSVHLTHVALAWLLARDVITAPIIGARTVAQFEQVVGAVNLRLTPEEAAALDTASAMF